MSEYYDHYHRWEPLAEFHFNLSDVDREYDEESYVYCLCSRAFIRDGVKTYYVDKEYGSESDVDVLNDFQNQEWDEESHVHFSLDTSYKVKCEKDEGASCYCSASHTDNYCSTDEHDPAMAHGTSHLLQPSDSGADLTYQDCHTDYISQDKLQKMEQDYLIDSSEFLENYLSEDTFEKFWAVNGERLIWASWIKKYSDYINPAYLDENNDLIMDDNNLPKQKSVDQIYDSQQAEAKSDATEILRERKFSYDSKVNPYKKSTSAQNPSNKIDSNHSNEVEDLWLPLARKRSCSEHDRILSPRTVAGTDSMTNVTKITMSSYEISSSHVTSESSPTDDYSMSSSTSDDQSNDQTRIANIEESLDQALSEEVDTQQYWQLLWKKHFGEQYALHCANFIQSHGDKSKVENESVPPWGTEKQSVSPTINIESTAELVKKSSEKLDIEIENSDGNSQEMPTVIEVQAQISDIKLEDKTIKTKKRNKKNSNRIIGSVGMLLQTLLKDEQKRNESCDNNEPTEASADTNKTPNDTNVIDESTSAPSNTKQSISNTNVISYSYDDGDDDPPEEKSVSLKRSHEIDEEEETAAKINDTFELMGFCVNSENLPKGQLIYRKRFARLRPPRYKKFGSKKTYFDDDGNPYQSQEIEQEKELQTDEDGIEAKSESEKELNASPEIGKETSSELSKPSDMTESEPVNKDSSEMPITEAPFNNIPVESTKRKRRAKRHTRNEETKGSEMPPELQDTPKMLKYWKKRHSLFHRFDEGIKLDLESWFSVTPENVARHIATKFAYDVVIDAFCGAGGNTIQFAKTCKKVIAIDIDPDKIELARHNAAVYGVTDNINFMVGDFFELAPQLEADMVFLSPPWGGPNYSENYEYDLETMLEPRPASELMDVARNITTNIALYLPRNTKSDQLLAIARDIGSSIEIEQSFLDRRFVAITAYFYQNCDL